jgi:hypothetical protein
MALAMEFDVFISYANANRVIADQAVARLENEGMKCWIAPRNIGASQNWPIEITRGIENSRLLLVVFSAESDVSQYVQNEVTLALDSRMPIIPLRIDNVPARGLRFSLANRQWVDGTVAPELYWGKLLAEVKVTLENLSASGNNWTTLPHEPGRGERVMTSTGTAALAAVVSAPDAPVVTAPTAVRKIAISYKRNSKPDEHLLQVLEPYLKSLGYSVFIDRHVAIGMQWASEISEQIKSSYALVILLSESSVHSEMVRFEAQIAHDESRLHDGRPLILPVRVQYSGPLPDPLHGILSTRQYFMWSGESDDHRLCDELVNAFHAPPPAPIKIGKIEGAGGAVSLDSPFYVVRSADQELNAAIDRRDSIICIKGPRQMGKTSLLARGLRQAKQSDIRTAFTNLQTMNVDDLVSAKDFYIAIADLLSDKLDVDASLASLWNPDRGANANFERFIKRQILAKIDGHLFWAIDEVDRLFTCSFGPETFGLFRTWHNARVADPSEPWSKLTLALSYATEAHLFIKNINQSPFNVGTRLELEEFTLDQVADLNRRHGTLLGEGPELNALYKLVRGHPFLVRRGLEEIARKKLGFASFEERADMENGPYGDHLRRILVMLAMDPQMSEAMTAVLDGAQDLAPEAFYRLRSAGLIDGDTAADARPRCLLYDKYLRRHLLKNEQPESA